MSEKKIINSLIKLADSLDRKGLSEESDQADLVLKMASSLFKDYEEFSKLMNERQSRPMLSIDVFNRFIEGFEATASTERAQSIASHYMDVGRDIMKGFEDDEEFDDEFNELTAIGNSDVMVDLHTTETEFAALMLLMDFLKKDPQSSMSVLSRMSEEDVANIESAMQGEAEVSLWSFLVDALGNNPAEG